MKNTYFLPLAGLLFFCSFLSAQPQGGLAKLDAWGDITWIVQTPNDLKSSSKLWLIPYPDGHLLYMTDKYQIEYDAEGEVKLQFYLCRAGSYFQYIYHPLTSGRFDRIIVSAGPHPRRPGLYQ